MTEIETVMGFMGYVVKSAVSLRRDATKEIISYLGYFESWRLLTHKAPLPILQ